MFCLFAKPRDRLSRFTKGPANVLPVPTYCTRTTDPCIFNSLRTLVSLSRQRAKIISFSFNGLRIRGDQSMSQLTFNLQPSRRALTVSELTARIRDLLSKNFTELSVEGEISNCREAQSGHLYFTLKDERAQIRCVWFKQDRRGVKFRVEDGMKVTLRGGIS